MSGRASFVLYVFMCVGVYVTLVSISCYHHERPSVFSRDRTNASSKDRPAAVFTVRVAVFSYVVMHRSWADNSSLLEWSSSVEDKQISRSCCHVPGPENYEFLPKTSRVTTCGMEMELWKSELT